MPSFRASRKEEIKRHITRNPQLTAPPKKGDTRRSFEASKEEPRKPIRRGVRKPLLPR